MVVLYACDCSCTLRYINPVVCSSLKSRYKHTPGSDPISSSQDMGSASFQERKKWSDSDEFVYTSRQSTGTYDQ